MDIKHDCENMYTSTPKINSSKNVGVDCYDRKTLGTLQVETVAEGKNQTSVHKFKDSSTTEGKHKTKLYYDEASYPSTSHTVKVYKDPGLPDECHRVLCTRGCQTESWLLRDLIQEELEKQISDPNDSGRVSGYISQEAHDLMSKDEVSEHYWRDLAEERRRALKETLAENERLCNDIDKLKEENRRLSDIALQAESLRELLEGMVSDDDPEESAPEQDSGSYQAEKLSDCFANEKLTVSVYETGDKTVKSVTLASSDRTAVVKARILAFMAEKGLPFSIAPELLHLCKSLVATKKALQKTTLSRQCATYTMTHGIAAAMKANLRETLKKTLFSMNVDEATNNANDKVLNILVRFFDDKEQAVKTHHFASKIVNQATAQNIFSAIADTLKDGVEAKGEEKESQGIPFNNIVSCLMDNCATMRGIRGGVETLMRKKNVHMLDVAGDTVHTVANAAKHLFVPFGKYMDNITSDIYYDLEKSPKAKDLFGEIQTLLTGEDNTLHILRPCPSRFLQMLQVTDRIAVLMDALRLYYFAFLTDEEKTQYRSVTRDIQQNVSSDKAARIKVIQVNQARQAKSSSNDSRKDRLLTALFKDFSKFKLMIDFYRGILTKFQDYVKKFQAEKPTVHQQHADMFDVVKKVLSLFMKTTTIPKLSVKELMEMKKDIRNRSSQLSDRDLCVGEFATSAYESALRDSKCYWAKDIATQLRRGYENAAVFLIEKLPLTNPSLIHLSSLDPKAHDSDATLPSLKALARSLPNVVEEKKMGSLDSEARDYIIDTDVKLLSSKYDSDKGRIDVDYWSKVFALK